MRYVLVSTPLGRHGHGAECFSLCSSAEAERVATELTRCSKSRHTVDDGRVLINSGEDAPTYLSTAELARDEAVVRGDMNGDNAVGLNISTAAVDTTGQLYRGSILSQDFYVFGKFEGHDSAVKGASLSGALLEADGVTAWESYSGYSVASGLDTSYLDEDNYRVEQRTVILQNDDNVNEVLRFDFELHASDLTDARGDRITSCTLIEDSETGKQLTPQELAALEKTYQRDADGDGKAELRSRMRGEVTDLLGDALACGLEVHPYTLRAEEGFLALGAEGRPQPMEAEAQQLLILALSSF